MTKTFLSDTDDDSPMCRISPATAEEDLMMSMYFLFFSQSIFGRYRQAPQVPDTLK